MVLDICRNSKSFADLCEMIAKPFPRLATGLNDDTRNCSQLRVDSDDAFARRQVRKFDARGMTS